MSPQPGEIWLADLGLAAKTRPIVIVSRQDPDPPRSLVLYVPLSTQRRDSPYEVPLPRLPFRETRASISKLRTERRGFSFSLTRRRTQAPAGPNWKRRLEGPQ